MIEVPFGAEYFVANEYDILCYYTLIPSGRVLGCMHPNKHSKQLGIWSLSEHRNYHELAAAFGDDLEPIFELSRFGTWRYLND